MMENENYSSVLALGPFEAYLAHTYALATNDYSVEHDSIPAYLAATSGIADVGFSVYNSENIGDLADAANRSWAAFEQSMPQVCDPTSNWAAGYDSNHNPFILFKDIDGNTTRCAAHDLTWSSWTYDVGINSIPNYSFIAPNTTNDDHNSTTPVGDAWLKSWLSPLVNDTAIFSSTAFLISYDESADSAPPVNGSSGGHIYTVVVSPYSRALTSDAFYNTYSLLTSAEWLLGLSGGTLGNDSWTLHPPIEDLFSFPTPSYRVTFTETGLPKAAGWSVTLGGLLQESTTSTITFTEPNGTYGYTVGSVPGYSITPASGSVSVSGTARNNSVTFAPTYSVTFTEKGLPKGTLWNVAIGPLRVTSVTSTIVFLEPNGSYPFQVGIVAGWSTTATGSVVVTGSSATVTRTFTQVKYVVTFKETGLPVGTNWSVTVGATSVSSTLTYINFHLTNGSYSYVVTNVANYSRSPTGSFAVVGAGLTITEKFLPVRYTVTFKEAGLPMGTNWSVMVGATTLWSTLTYINFHLINGSYAYAVANVANYSRSPTGSFSVSGAGLTITEKFSLVKYAVTFKETGLPVGTNWSVTVGAMDLSSTLTYMNFHLTNGSYSYTVANVANYSRTASGELTVAGTGLTLTIPFTLVKYKVTVTESGLPPHTSWQVTIGSITHSTTGTTLSFTLANGTYAYNVSAPGSGYAASNGSVSVNGAALGMTTAFSLQSGPGAGGWTLVIRVASKAVLRP